MRLPMMSLLLGAQALDLPRVAQNYQVIPFNTPAVSAVPVREYLTIIGKIFKR